jgi:hypothetical protein
MSKPGQTSRPRKLPTPGELAARDRRIATALRSGVPLQTLRERFGMGEDAIKRIAARNGATPRKTGRP